MTPIEIAWTMLAAAVFATSAFAWMTVSAARLYHHRLRDHEDKRGVDLAEHGLVVMSGLTLIAAANIVTGAGFVRSDPALVNIGALVVRGALVGLALYLVVRRPDR